MQGSDLSTPNNQKMVENLKLIKDEMENRGYSATDSANYIRAYLDNGQDIVKSAEAHDGHLIITLRDGAPYDIKQLV